MPRTARHTRGTRNMAWNGPLGLGEVEGKVVAERLPLGPIGVQPNVDFGQRNGSMLA